MHPQKLSTQVRLNSPRKLTWVESFYYQVIFLLVKRRFTSMSLLLVSVVRQTGIMDPQLCDDLIGTMDQGDA